MLARIYQACRVALSWDRAVTLAAQENYERALAELEDAWKRWDDSPPPKYALLRAYIQCHRGRHDLAILDITDAYEALTSKRWYPAHENNYLINYAATFGMRMAESKGRAGGNLFASELPSFDRKKISGYTRKVFPLKSL